MNDIAEQPLGVAPTMALRTGDRIKTPSGMPLIVARKYTYGDERGLVLTGDGRPYTPQWHDGEGDHDYSIYYEAWADLDDNGRLKRIAHGWIDVQSRKIVQGG